MRAVVNTLNSFFLFSLSFQSKISIIQKIKSDMTNAAHIAFKFFIVSQFYLQRFYFAVSQEYTDSVQLNFVIHRQEMVNSIFKQYIHIPHYKAFKIVWFTHLYLKKEKQTKQYLGKPFSDYKLRRLEQIFLTNERFFVVNFFILNRYILMNLYSCSFFYYLRLVVFIQLQSISVAMIY